MRSNVWGGVGQYLRAHRAGLLLAIAVATLCAANAGATNQPATAVRTFTWASKSATAFSIVAMPDTQYETERDYRYDTARVARSIQWIVDRKTTQKIKYVVSSGDIVNATSFRSSDTASLSSTGNEKRVRGMYAKASRAYQRLNNAGIPYSVTAGNHDVPYMCYEGTKTTRLQRCGTRDDLRNTTLFNQYFSQSKLGLSASQVCESGKSENAHQYFTVNDTKWLVVSIEFWPRATMVDCAKAAIEAHPDHNVIINTHAFLTNDVNGVVSSVITDEITTNYCAQYEVCKTPTDLLNEVVNIYPNIKLVLSGHRNYGGYNETFGAPGNRVASLMTTIHASYDNPIRVITIDTEKGTVSSTVRSASHYSDKASAYGKYKVTISGMSFIKSSSSAPISH